MRPILSPTKELTFLMAGDASAIAATGSSFTAASRRRDLIQLSVGYALILLVIWTPSPWQKPLYLATILWVILSTCISFDGWRPMGLRVSIPFRSLWIIAASLTLAVIAIAIATRLHTLRQFEGLAAFIQRYWGYAIFAFAQQFLLQAFFLLRLLRLLPTRTTAVVVAASLFALAHLPNPILTPITFVWGLAACLLFLRYRNIYPLAISHAILGISLAITIPGPIDHNMRVGLGYLTYRPHHVHHRSHSDHIVSTEACVIAAAPTLRS
jgi:Type II CAAX prenyl endopeptidase Rce1-like